MRTTVAATGGALGGLAIGLSSAFWKFPFDPTRVPWADITANGLGAMIGGGIAVILATSTFRQERRAALADEERRRQETAESHAKAQLYEATAIRTAIGAASEACLNDFDIKHQNLLIAIESGAKILSAYNILHARAREAVTRAVTRGEQVAAAIAIERDANLGVIQGNIPIPGVKEIADAAIAYLIQDARLCMRLIIADDAA